MEPFVEGVEQVHALAVRLERSVASLNSRERADACSAWLALMDAADRVETLLASTRACPGPYWRRTMDVQSLKKRKTKKAPTYECKASTRHQPTFARAEYGPLREDGGDRMLCDACAQIWHKDQKLAK